MVLIYGSNLFGKVDEVPGLFHVATKFDHVYYVPILPLKTYLVLEREGRYVQIRMSFKSVFLAWGRAVLLVTAFFSLCMSILAGHFEPNGRVWLIALLVAGVSSILFASSYVLRKPRRASVTRAMALARRAELGDEALAEIGRIYGQSVQTE
jgi:hypothetical protein